MSPARLTRAALYPIGRVARLFIRVYQLLVSPLIGPVCRFTPSCSHYALEALDRHGPARGAWLAARRIGRCHPWSRGGHDPVPEPRRTSSGP